MSYLCHMAFDPQSLMELLTLYKATDIHSDLLRIPKFILCPIVTQINVIFM